MVLVLFTRIEGSGSPWGLAELYTGSEDHSVLNYKKMGVVLGSGVDHRSRSVPWRPLQGLRLMLQIKEKWINGCLGPGKGIHRGTPWQGRVRLRPSHARLN